MTGEALIKVEAIGKKFCRSLKRSLWYGFKDIAVELVGRSRVKEELRSAEFWAVQEVSFELLQGECLGLLGGNGAGKTTLLKMLNGLIKPDNGTIEVRGRIGALIALGAGFNPVLTGRENIYVNGSVFGLRKREMDVLIDEIIDFAELGEFVDAPVQSYSSGMSVRLGFAVATAIRPEILLLDEVLAVGDAAFQAKCFNRIGQFRREGTAFILVSHNMHQISRFCDRAIVLNRGRVAFAGATGEAIATLLAEMMTPADKASNAPEVRTQTGSGAVAINEVTFLDADQNVVTEIASGSPITLCVKFRRQRDLVHNPVIDVTFRDGGDLYFQGTNRSFGCELGSLPAAGAIHVHILCVPSNNQNLEINVAMWDTSFTELFDWVRGARLRVIGNALCAGKVLLQSSWGVVETREVASRKVLPPVSGCVRSGRSPF